MKSGKITSLLFLIIVSLSLIGRTVFLSPRQPMWLDEVYTYYALLHESFTGLWRSLHTNVNAAPPGYFLLMWESCKIFPLCPLTLRLFSSICCCGAFALIWSTLRRHTSFFVAAVATTTVLLTSELFLKLNSEARFYGLYLLTIAWTVHNYDMLCTKEPSKGRLVLNALSHAAALSVMYLSGFYCLGILIALVLRDRFLKLWRPKVYLSILVGWIPVLFYLPFLLVQKVATKFTIKQGPTQAFQPFDAGVDTNRTYFVLGALAVLLVVALLRQSGARKMDEKTLVPRKETSLHLALVAVAFLAVPYEILAVSLTGVAPLLILQPRYCLPSLLGLVLLFGLIGRAVRDGLVMAGTSLGASRRIALTEMVVKTLLVIGLVSWPMMDAMIWARYTAHNPPKRAPGAKGDPAWVHDLPVMATTDPMTYYVRYFYSGDDRRIFFVLTSRKAYDMGLRYQKRLNLIMLNDFLAKYPRFSLVSDDARYEWLEAMLRKRGGYVFKHEQREGNRKWLAVFRK